MKNGRSASGWRSWRALTFDHWGAIPGSTTDDDAGRNEPVADAPSVPAAVEPVPEHRGDMSASSSAALVRDVKAADEHVLHITTGATMMEAVRVLAERRVGLVLVCDKEGHLADVLSERDIVSGLAANGPGALEMEVCSFVTPDVFTCGSTDRLADVAAVMSERRFRHVPIVDDGVLKGMISASDIVRHYAATGAA